MKSCEYCGEETINPKFCSLSCSSKAYTRVSKFPYTKECLECCQEFLVTCSNESVKKFCTRSCSARYNNKKKPKRQKESSSTKPCRVCGTPVYRAVYCSQICKEAEKAERASKCHSCGVPLDSTNRVSNRNSCRTCYNKYQAAYHKKYYYKIREELIEFLGVSCSNCGSTENLEFDHIDYLLKEFDISVKWAYKRDTVVEELKKCQLLCSLCHQEKTTEDLFSMGRVVEHGGGVSGKRNCRCSACKKAHADYMKDYRRKKKLNN